MPLHIYLELEEKKEKMGFLDLQFERQTFGCRRLTLSEAAGLVHALHHRQDLSGRLLQRLHHLSDVLGQKAKHVQSEKAQQVENIQNLQK